MLEWLVQPEAITMPRIAWFIIVLAACIRLGDTAIAALRRLR